MIIVLKITAGPYYLKSGSVMQTWLNLQDKIIIVTGGDPVLVWRL